MTDVQRAADFSVGLRDGADSTRAPRETQPAARPGEAKGAWKSFGWREWKAPSRSSNRENQNPSAATRGGILIFKATAAREERAPIGGKGNRLPAIEETSEAPLANRKLLHILCRGVPFESSTT